PIYCVRLPGRHVGGATSRRAGRARRFPGRDHLGYPARRPDRGRGSIRPQVGALSLMLARLVELSIRRRLAMVTVLVAVLVGGIVATRALPIDAVPDVTTIQVSVLTEAQGLSPVEVERSVTFPIEMALNGT